ncbi:MAG TPA: hypothetical protein VKQ36_02465 [Ktedonobacterales bacterium]|nr:hypothetical protein [Ktedonobacterales bacterium]
MRNCLCVILHWKASALLLGVGMALLLGGCASLGTATPPATPTPPATATPQIIQDPEVDCDTAMQLVRQKDVSEVDIYYDNTGLVVAMDVNVTHNTQAFGLPIPAGDNYIYQITTHCPDEMLATVQQVNQSLPASAQIKVVKQQIPS